MSLMKLTVLMPLLFGFGLAGFGAPALADDDDDDKRAKHGWYEDRHGDRRDHRGWDDRGWDDRGWSDRGRDHRRDHRRWDRHDDRRQGWDRREHWRDHRDHRGRVVYREVHRGPVIVYGPGHGFGPPPRYYGPPPRHYGPPRWARGHRIHDYGWAPTYVIVDYGRHGLRHPPHGHHWRRDERGDWLLVAIASGIIAEVIFR